MVQLFRLWGVSRARVALKDSARALSAELHDRAHGLSDAGPAAGVGEGPAGLLSAVVGVQDHSGEAAAGAFGGGQSVGDELGAHVICDRPAGQAA